MLTDDAFLNHFDISLKKTVAESQAYFGGKEIIRTEDESIVSVFSCCGMYATTWGLSFS